MPPKKPSTPPDKRKRARGNLEQPLPSWFQTDLQKAKQKALKKSPVFDLCDFYYVRMLERNILTVKDETFGLHRSILKASDPEALPPNKAIILAYLIVEALREYARAEWAWLNQDPGEFARELSQLAQKVQSWQDVIFEDKGQLAKTLQQAAAKVEKKWNKGKAVEQTALYARRRLIRDIRLLVGEFLPLPNRKQSAVTNLLCVGLMDAFNIRTSSDQDIKKLLHIVRQDRQRHDASFKEFDDMHRSSLKRKTVILKRYPHGNAAQKPYPDSRFPLPPHRICTTPFELRSSWPPLLDPTDYSLPDLHDLY